MGDPVSENETVYRWEPTTRFERRVIELDRRTGKLHMENEAPSILRYALYILMLILLIGTVIQNQLLIDSGAVTSLLLFFGFRAY